jgi:beta-galactosidase
MIVLSRYIRVNKILIVAKSLFLAFLVFPLVAFSQTMTRQTENFDFEWKFLLGDTSGASAPVYDDSKWEKVQIPHDWSIKLPLNKKNGGAMGFLPGGIGWYRKKFPLSTNYKGKKIVIRFDGVYHQADVYINGKHLGFHPYGYTGFEYDLTPHLNYGGQNTIAVRVDHSNSPSSRWYSGSGIYRHVWLQITNPVHVATWGTYITTPDITESSAEVKIATTIKNGSTAKGNVQVQNRIIGADGKEVVVTSSSTSIEEGKEAIIDQSMPVRNPRLWSIDTPYLYRMETTVKVKGKITDQYSTSFGIRSLRFDADKGFFLNGKGTKLKGFCIHQDAGSLGTAVPDASNLRRLKILKEYGVNAIRCSHNPPSPEFLDMCDSLGFVVIDEAFDKWKAGYYSKYFDDWWQKDMDAMLLRDRNHPSIILWSIGNETIEQHNSTGTGTARLVLLRDYVRKVDPTRLVTAAIAPGNTNTRIYNKSGFTEALDVVGYNYQEPWLADDKKTFPRRLMYVAEAFPYYRGRPNNIRDYNPTNPWYYIAENDFIMGQFIWAGIDYLGESSGWPSTGWPTGLFDVSMFEKPIAAFHRSVWKDEPMVRIAVADQALNIDPGKDHWSWPYLAGHWNFPQYDGHIIEVETTTNCDSVELWVNEKSMGKRARADWSNNTIQWHVPYKAGEIKAIGYNKEKEVAKYELRTAGKTAKIRLSADRMQINADGQDLSHITIELIDDKGNVVPDSDQKITVEVTGNGRLLGLDNGDLRSESFFSVNPLKTYFGRALATVQSGRSKGEIQVKVLCGDLPVSILSIKCN